MRTRRTIVALFLSVMLVGVAMAASEYGSKDTDAKKMTLTGEITAVSADSGTFTVQPADSGAKAITFRVDDQTRYMRDGKAGQKSDLAKGEKVTVSYETQESGNVAVSVWIG